MALRRFSVGHFREKDKVRAGRGKGGKSDVRDGVDKGAEGAKGRGSSRGVGGGQEDEVYGWQSVDLDMESCVRGEWEGVGG